ncbi:hypothetical protein BDP27DRAFT_1371071 [Rhodocollybia butyracea]|uniref:Uncharacterized protein n=1 Tax=Rhodocollybia butyracea TaxID=206335 RepID=A0A9P5TXU8_9AGAR|nr:hypothetical protein BDP27DRAFT_1371071 [Rhodocollybia butyracea]
MLCLTLLFQLHPLSLLLLEQLLLELLCALNSLPSRVFLLRTRTGESFLNCCNYKGNVSEFILCFQKLEIQLSPTDMTFGDPPAPMDLDAFSTTPSHLDKSRPQQPMFHIADPDPLHPGRMHIVRQPSARSQQAPTLLGQAANHFDNQKKFVHQKDVDQFLANMETQSVPKAELDDPPLSANFFTINLKATVQGRPKRFKPGSMREVHIIANTGAQDNYIHSNVVKYIGADYFSLGCPQEIAGAGQTFTKGFARFTLKIGPIKETTKVTIKVQPIPNPNSLPVQDVYMAKISEGIASIIEVESRDESPGIPPSSGSETPSLTTDNSSTDTLTPSTDTPKIDSDTTTVRNSKQKS